MSILLPCPPHLNWFVPSEPDTESAKRQRKTGQCRRARWRLSAGQLPDAEWPRQIGGDFAGQGKRWSRKASRMCSKRRQNSNFADFSRYSSGLWSSSSARSSANLATPLRPQSDDFSLSASFPSANNKVHPVPIAVAATPSDFGAISSRSYAHTYWGILVNTWHLKYV